ncbi:MAG: dTDP-4-dehydrorhamnose reductase [Cyanobacteria bacterium NC_groundwater_1444_Ag_S-0.65um_54_12]|nr:dTDP-4-dehydrorhamnose reductase [Cyanobacteria bacterium NC_groundwater_1444_Ag_S-0.65um_54_12]
MRVFIAGLSGMLGQALAKALIADGQEVYGCGQKQRAMLDLPSAAVYQCYSFGGWELETIADLVGTADIVINAAAYTKVDQAELEELEAYRVNALFAGLLARICELKDCDLAYISSDYVFDGKANRPYREHAMPNPLSAYGRSKLAGEIASRRIPRHYVIRTSWLFGESGANFVKTVCKLAKERTELRIVDDQFGCPTYAQDLAVAMARLIKTGRYGTYHLTNKGMANWFELACEIVTQLNLPVTVLGQSTAEARRLAPRPAFGVLDNWAWQIAGEPPLPCWQDALGRYLNVAASGSLAR